MNPIRILYRIETDNARSFLELMLDRECESLCEALYCAELVSEILPVGVFVNVHRVESSGKFVLVESRNFCTDCVDHFVGKGKNKIPNQLERLAIFQRAFRTANFLAGVLTPDTDSITKTLNA